MPFRDLCAPTSLSGYRLSAPFLRVRVCAILRRHHAPVVAATGVCEMMNQIAEASPRFKARLAGALYLLSLLAASCTELFLRGPLNIAGGLIAVAGMAAMTLLLYAITRPVNRRLSMLAAFFSLVGLTFEALRLQPRGVNVAIVFHGLFCLLIGYLIFSS